LKLPWQLGARFFLEHLYDGDAGSNTLSWRWVAGLQTKGKHYLAKPWNIRKYTNERYLNFQLNEQSQSLHEDHAYSIEPFPYGGREEKLNDYLLLTDNDLNFNNRSELYKKYKRIFILKLGNERRIIPISRKVLEFKDSAISSFKKYYPHAKICDDTFEEVAKSIIDFDVVYPFVGENLDYINQLKSDLQLNINFLVRREDSFCIPLCKKGFFDFKKNIPEIIKIIKN
jgi:deoxyribodipyrimidine photo-lyase